MIKQKKRLLLINWWKYNDNNYDENNTSSEVIIYEFKNNIFRDSTNSLINNIEIINTKYNENEKNGKLSI